MKVLPPRYTPLLLALITSFMMSSIMSMVITFLNLGWVADFPLRWLQAWLTAFLVAFPVTLLVLPVARRIVAALTNPDSVTENP